MDPINRLTVDGVVPLIATVDVGTTSSRAILFNRLGQEVAKHQIEYSTSASKEKYAASGKRRPSLRVTPDGPIFSAEGIAIKETQYLEIEDLKQPDSTLRFPRPGWVECRPMNILENVEECLARTFSFVWSVNKQRVRDGLAPYRVRAMGVANMRETTIVWSHKTGLPVIDYGLVWNDTRNAEIVAEKKRLTPAHEQERLQAKIGLPLYSTYFSCSKLRWLLDNEPAVAKAYENGDLMFGTVDTWLIYNLTHNHAFISDVTNASRTGFMNLDTLDYDDELLEYWGIDRTKVHLPKITSSAQYFGDFKVPEVTKSWMEPGDWEVLEKLSKRKPSIPVQGCLGDQSASLVGQLAFKPGAAKCTYGTGCFLLFNTGSRKLISKHGALTTFGYWFPYLDGADKNSPHFALEGSVAVAGAVVQWLRDNLRLIPKAEDVGPLACRVPDSGGVVFVPAFSGLFAPYWDPEARATIMGMSQHTTASHIARAAVEGVCFQARAILTAMSSDALGEGAKDRDFLEEMENDDELEGKSALKTLAVDGGMSKSDEVMQIQADILGPCIKVRRSPTSECTALGAAIAAEMGFKDPKDRVMWKDLKDVKKWVFYNGIDKGDFIPPALQPNLKVFESQSADDERRHKRLLWDTAVERSLGWMSAITPAALAEPSKDHLKVPAESPAAQPDSSPFIPSKQKDVERELHRMELRKQRKALASEA
ncbi:probable Glycerol kinase [Zygosaccharomyces bailii]|nr:probable Glycerol kinase [Zygosaccharomyces bailii]